ncbi:MAG TPA: hypothetical protein VGK96_02660 [Candidatus Sulfotelmatobacter sp.]|jgi:hypothetical protein
MLSIGASLAATEKWLFITAYAFIVLAAFWTLGYWLTSDTLQKRDPRKWSRNRRKQSDLKRAIVIYRFWMWGGVITCVAGVALSVLFTNFVWERKELSELGGLLVPANDPNPSSYCSLGANELGIEFGEMSAKAKYFPVDIIQLYGEPAVTIDKNQDGTINLSLELTGSDHKVMLSLDRNSFKIPPGNYLSMRRPDRSTVTIDDAYNNQVRIRYLNPHYFSVKGRLMFGGETIDLIKDIPLLPPHTCFDAGNGARAIIDFK